MTTNAACEHLAAAHERYTFPHGRKSQIDFIPEDAVTFKAAAKSAGLRERIDRAP